MYEATRKEAPQGSVNTGFEVISAHGSQQPSDRVFTQIDNGPAQSTFDFFVAAHELLNGKSA
jgi:hypothetical protein